MICGIQQVPKVLFCISSLKIIFLKLMPHFPGVNELICNNFHSIKCIWECLLLNVNHFVLASMCSSFVYCKIIVAPVHANLSMVFIISIFVLVQSDALTARSNITLYRIQHCSNLCRTWIRLWTAEDTPCLPLMGKIWGAYIVRIWRKLTTL